MKYILYNAKEEDIKEIKDKAKDKDILILSKKKLFKEDLKYHRIESRFWLQEWSYTKIKDKTIKELFQYNNQTLFYLLNFSLLRDLFLFKGKAGLNLTLTLIDIFDDFIDEDISVISYDPHDGYFVKLLRKVCKKKKVNLKILRDEDLSIGKLEFLRNHIWTVRLLIQMRIAMIYLIGLIRKLTRKTDNKKTDVLFLSNTRFYRKRDEDNTMFGNIIKGLNKQKIKNKTLTYVLSSSEEYFKEFIFKFMFNKMKYIGDYYSLRILFKNHKLFKKYLKIWKRIRNSLELKKSLEYKSINIYDVSLPVFDLTFNALIYLVIDNLNITNEIIQKEKPKVFVLDHDNNFYGKGLLINSKNSDIKSVALQHEAVLFRNTNHAHIKDKRALDKTSVFWRPLATKKCVTGFNARRVLLEIGNYTNEHIEVTGDPNFDNLFDEKSNKANIIKKYNLSRDSKKILFGERYVDGVKEFIIASSKLPDFEFLIKPHPSTDIKLHKELIERYKAGKLKLIPKTANVYELVSVSDILIGKRSTIGLAAMSKGIPMIFLNTTKDPDPWEYAISGGALSATNEKELEKAIINLNNKKIRDSVLKKHKLYVKDMLYKTDGKASDRIVNVIKKLLS